MKKKVLCLLMCFCLMAGMMSGCGAEGEPVSGSGSTEQTDESASNESGNADVPSTAEPTAEPTVEPTTEPTPEPTPETASNTFAEENQLLFTEPTDMSLPCFHAIVTDSGEYVTETKHFKVRDTPANYSFLSFEKGEPDADGNVTYTIRWKTEDTFCIDVILTPWDTLSSETIFSTFGLVDYYTGTILNPHDNASCELDITWGDTTYPISCTKTFEYFSEWTVVNQDVYLESVAFSENSYIITVPADYDGLMLYISGDGCTYYDEGVEDPEYGTILEMEEDNNLIFIRVNDCVE